MKIGLMAAALGVGFFGFALGAKGVGETTATPQPAESRPASQPVFDGDASQPAIVIPKGKNLTAVPGVTLVKVVLTEEEEEEQKGLRSQHPTTWNNLAGGRVMVSMQGTPEEILVELSSSKKIVQHGVTLPTSQYQLVATAAYKDMLPTVERAFADAFKVHVVEEKREVKALRLEGDLKVLKTLPRPEGNASDEGDENHVRIPPSVPAASGSLHGEAAQEGTMKQLAAFISAQVHMPVFDHTGTEAAYRVKVAIDFDKPLESIEKSLSTQGLKLAPAKAWSMAVHVDPITSATRPAGGK